MKTVVIIGEECCMSWLCDYILCIFDVFDR